MGKPKNLSQKEFYFRREEFKGKLCTGLTDHRQISLLILTLAIHPSQTGGEKLTNFYFHNLLFETPQGRL